MTVCLAAIATYQDPHPILGAVPRDVVVLASDRMITYGDVLEYEMQDQTKSFHLVSNRILAMGAGENDWMLPIFQAAHKRIRDGDVTSVKLCAEIVAEEFQSLRRDRNRRRVLEPLGLTYDDLFGGRALPDDLLERLEIDLRSRRAIIEGEAVVAGIGSDGAGIYVIRDPGEAYPQNAAAFAAIGIGAQHAESIFMGARYTHSRPWLEALMIAYRAKKRAEVAPGVGRYTDLWWITSDDYAYWEDASSFQAELRRIYGERIGIEEASLQEDVAKISAWLTHANANPEEQTQTDSEPDEPPDEGPVSSSPSEGGPQT